MEFKGISKEALFLLADNKFRDSRDFYEEHKEEIKSSVTVPMRQIAAEVGNELFDLDPLMNLNPVKMVSRVRRDTRYTKDKHLYRDNMWIMFMRDKHQWINYPCFWFEVEQTGYSMGIGFFGTQPGLMDVYRKNIREKTDEFRAAIKKCEKTGALLYGNEYKRLPAGCPDGLERYYIHKDFGFIKYSDNFDDLADKKIIEIITETYKEFSPLYKFMLATSDEYFSKNEE